MKSYHQYCPIARGAEVLATRWTLVIVRNLLLGCRTFTELREGAPGIPRSVLSERLRQLEEHGIVARRQNPDGRGWWYEPTQAGRELQAVCDAIGAWGAAWVELGPQHLDPYASLWAIARGLHRVELPAERINARFEFPDLSADRRRFWLLVHEPAPEVCVRHPGYDEDLIVVADPEWLARWVLGERSFSTAVRTGEVEVTGPRDVVRTLGRLGELAASSLSRWGEPAAGA